MSRQDRNVRGAAQAQSTEDTKPAEATAAVPAETRKRNPVVVGKVDIKPSTREIKSSRPTLLDSNPVATAVRDAKDGDQLETPFEEGKSDAIISVLRRAGTHFKRGVNILAVIDNPASGDAPAERVIVFKVTKRREKKTATPAVPAAPTTDDKPAEWAGPTHEAPTE